VRRGVGAPSKKDREAIGRRVRVWWEGKGKRNGSELELRHGVYRVVGISKQQKERRR